MIRLCYGYPLPKSGLCTIDQTSDFRTGPGKSDNRLSEVSVPITAPARGRISPDHPLAGQMEVVEVMSVNPCSAAWEANLRQGDSIVSIGAWRKTWATFAKRYRGYQPAYSQPTLRQCRAVPGDRVVAAGGGERLVRLLCISYGTGEEYRRSNRSSEAVPLQNQKQENGNGLSLRRASRSQGGSRIRARLCPGVPASGYGN
jgi:hypothetical protein